jgi:hypothetical protein
VNVSIPDLHRREELIVASSDENVNDHEVDPETQPPPPTPQGSNGDAAPEVPAPAKPAGLPLAEVTALAGEDIGLFIGHPDVPYIRLPDGQSWPLDSARARAWMVDRFVAKERQIPKESELKTLIALFMNAAWNKHVPGQPDSPLVDALVALVEADWEWSGSATKLRDRLLAFPDKIRPEQVPAANVLGRELSRLARTLRRRGIDVTSDRTNKGRVWTLRQVADGDATVTVA